MENNTVYEWILHSTFTVAARAKSLEHIKPSLSRIVRARDEVLDLCCGSGLSSFWFEDRGAKVTGIDFAPYMIALAKEEAVHRDSQVQFIEADIFIQDFGRDRYDLVSCFGNSISDFPVSHFAKLGNKIARALKPGARFVLDYHDGSYEFMKGCERRASVYQETPERVTFRFKDYLPEQGARVAIIRNESRGEEYERKGYIYTKPVVHLAMSNVLEPEQHIVLSENHFLDVFVRK